jgi:cysteine synthase B
MEDSRTVQSDETADDALDTELGAQPDRNAGDWTDESAVHPFHGADGVLRGVGNTPLVRLARSVEGLVKPGVEVWVKLEGANPGGSVKDRAALSILLDAERKGRLKPGGVVLDASSGNTGIAYAMVCARRGYHLKLCLPKNANGERKALLRAYGAEIIETSPLEGSDGAIRRARELASENPDWLYLDQYGNDANWRAHFHSTGPEIWRDTNGRVTHFVATVGTSGTLMGTGRFLKSKRPDITLVEVQPDSPFHGLEGLKHMESAIVPPIYDDALADVRVGAPTEPAYDWVRKLAREEGILVGPSSGASVWAALQVAKTLDDGVVVAMTCDSGMRYLSETHLWTDA